MRRDEELNCMTFVAGRRASATGRVLVAHNEDDTGVVAVRHGLVPPARWPEGSAMPAEPGLAAIPQVERTLGFYWSEVSTPEGGMSTSDVFYNERGVCIVSNSCMQSREDGSGQPGGISYNLRRAVAERAVSARDAIHILMELVDRWGYAPSGRAYTVADADEAFMIQIAQGRRYVAIRVPDDCGLIMPNHYTIHDPAAFDEFWMSDGLAGEAVRRGWCAPGTFDFARAYQHPDSVGKPVNVLRQRFSALALTGEDCGNGELPFAVRPKEPVTVEKMMALLSNHYDGAPEDVRIGPGGTPHGTPNNRVCDGSTVESSVFDLRRDPRLTTLWLTAGRPCQQPWLPLHPLCGLPEAFAPMADSAAELARHLLPDPARMAQPDTGIQRLRDFGDAMEMVYADNAAAVREALANLRARAVRADAEAVAEAQSLLGEGREADAVARLAQAADGQVCAALAAVEALGARFVRAKVQTLSVRSPGGEWSPPQPAFDTEAIARRERGEVFGSRCETRDDAETCTRRERGEVFGSWCETRDDAEACAQCECAEASACGKDGLEERMGGELPAFDAAAFAEGGRIRLTFACEGAPEESSLLLGRCRTRDLSGYAPAVPGSLAALGDGVYAAEFDAHTAVGCDAPGRHVCVFGGTDGAGAFTSLVALTID